MTDIELLQAARALIADPVHWTYDTLARDRHGGWTNSGNSNAAAWCAVGAIYRVCRGAERPVVDRLCAALDDVAHRYFGWTGVSSLNDFLGHGAMLKVYDITIREMVGAPPGALPVKETSHA